MFDYDARPVTPQVILAGTHASAAAYAIRDFLTRNGQPYDWVDADQPGAELLLHVEKIDASRLPLCVLPDGTRLESATVEQVAAGLGMVSAPRLAEYDLTIVGDGWYLAALKDLTERLGLGPRVTFRGGLQGADLIRACRFADVAVVPSIYPEPSGLVVPELRSLGIPVVVTDAGGLSEWAARYSRIHIADAANPASLAAAIRNAARGRHGSAPGRTVPPDDLLSLIEGLHTIRMQAGGVALGV